MVILIPRSRTISVRLSEDEYASLEKFCVETGARSISELARNAVSSYVSRVNQENALASTVSQNVEQVKELQRRIEALTAELALFKASTAGRESCDG